MVKAEAKLMHKDIGLDVKAPASQCSDGKCPFHGKLTVRGRVFDGVVRSDLAKNTATVTWEYFTYYPKYERLARKNTSIAAHNPPCMAAKKGDKVLVAECRPLSKTKKFVIVEVYR